MTVFSVAPIASTELAHDGAHALTMNNPIASTFVKCASPECRSAARDGHVCSYHYGTIYADRTFDATGESK